MDSTSPGPRQRRRRDTAPATEQPGTAAPLLSELLTFRLIKLAETISRGSSMVYKARFGINNTELRVLVMLDGSDALPVGELSRRMRIDKAWVSRSVDALVGRGLLRKRPHPTDSRVGLVSLTPEGLRLVAQLAPVAVARHESMVAGLDMAEVERVVSELERRVEALLAQSREG
ncbi:MarR family winged helix-turn-helix transcriptional regulator [Roseomonas sp. BN140053]|uniref:MarR family winged helix-turn-helix transcriptional regulator n=1 Tax=Roseomonas sp. BN140053 TaxID=3391898 RepID=UPI0039ECE361